MRPFWILLLASLLTCGFAADCNGDWQFEELFFNDQIVAYYLNAIDMDTGAQNFDLFQYRIFNKNDEYLPSDDFEFEYTIQIFSPQLGFDDFTDFGVLRAHVSQIQHELIIRNTDLTGETTVAGALVDDVTWDSIDLADSYYDAYTSVMLQNGRLPDGIYRFISRLNYQNSISCELVETLEVYEPAYLELIAPGGPMEDLEENAIHTTYPVFNWNSDYCAEINGESKCSLGIRVCEYILDVHGSLSDAISDISVLPLRQEEDYYPINSKLQVFQYPSSSALDLQSGKTYVWQLRRQYETTSGQEDLLSDIYIFRVDLSTGQWMGDRASLELLRALLGEEQYKSLFDPGGKLENYSLADDSFLLNDREQSVEQLITTLQELLSKDTKVTGVEVQP